MPSNIYDVLGAKPAFPIAQSVGSSATAPNPIATPQPISSVASYVNQNLSGGVGSPVVTPSSIGAPSPQAQALVNRATPLTPMQQSAQNTINSVKVTNDNLQSIINNSPSAQKARQSGGVGYGNMSGAGQAWKPDGTLSESRNKVLSTASSYLGSKYVLGGTTKQGIDCSGLVMSVYDQLGYGQYLDSHSATRQAKNIPGIRTSLSNLRPGDLVAWKDGSHIAIYAGNNQIIEAANERVGTVRRNLWANPNAVYGIALKLPGE